MVGLTQLVNEALARHGVDAELDLLRLRWSPWFRCGAAFSVIAAPGKPGLFALAEEVVAPEGSIGVGGKRMLALFQISETDDLGMTLGRLFLPGNPDGSRFSNKVCFVRFAVVEESRQRRFAHAALQQWMADSADTTMGPSSNRAPKSSNKEAQSGLPEPFPDGFSAPSGGEVGRF